MRYLSLFSGIEAASVAWEPLGWTPVAFAEIDPFCCELLQHYWPSVPNLGDVETITADVIDRLGAIDLVVFGSPCQDLSVAGKRKGLEGERSGLFRSAARVIRLAIERSGCRWAVWENVPGAFSSNGGRDFASVVGALVGCDFDVPDGGWKNSGAAVGPSGFLEWGVLDTQHFGLAQRRDRVFVVVDFGDWTRRAPILLEPESLRGDHPPRRETGARVAGTFGARSLGRGSSCGGDGRESFYVAGALTSHHLRGVPEAEAGQLVASTLSANSGRLQVEATYIPEVADPITANEGSTYTHEGSNNFRLHNVIPVAAPITSGSHPGSNAPGQRHEDDVNLVACFDETQITHPENRSTAGPDTAHVAASAGPPAVVFSMRGREGGNMPEIEPEDVSPALRQPSGGSSAPFVLNDIAVRRLTPKECERLFGFPDDWTLIPYRGKPAKDIPRYAALGNSIGITPLQWIGRRIAAA